MLTKHVTKHLSAYHHGELSADEQLRVETHLRECLKCRTACEEIRLGAQFASTLSITSAPDSIWHGIQLQNSPPNFGGELLHMALAVGFAVIAAFAAGLFLESYVWDRPSWDVAINGTNRRLRA